jgi:hypothetical protein
MVSGTTKRLSVEDVCKRWEVGPDHVIKLGANNEIDIWVGVEEVTVDEVGEAPQYHRRFELKLLPRDLDDLIWPSDRFIETDVLNGKVIGDLEDVYVLVRRVIPEDGNFIIRRSDLFLYQDAVVEYENLHHIEIPSNIGSNPKATINTSSDSPNLYTLRSKKQIADHIGKSESWVKQKMKESLPHKKESNRRITANPVEIDKWVEQNKKK